jgi:hypothetical protein
MNVTHSHATFDNAVQFGRWYQHFGENCCPHLQGRNAEREQMMGKYAKEDWGMELLMNQQELERNVLSFILPGWGIYVYCMLMNNVILFEQKK